MESHPLVAWLLGEASALVATSTPESRTHRIDVLAEWLATLLSAQDPNAIPRRIALTDATTGAPCEEVMGAADLEIEIETDDAAFRGSIRLERNPPASLRPR